MKEIILKDGSTFTYHRSIPRKSFVLVTPFKNPNNYLRYGPNPEDLLLLSPGNRNFLIYK